jgi:hypothetical protein
MNQIEKCMTGAALALLAALPAAGQSWSVSDPAAKSGNVYAAAGDTPVVLQLADVGSDDYLVAGQLLLPQPKTSVQIGLGNVDLKTTGRKPIPGKIACGADTLGLGGPYRAFPGVNETWIDFSLSVVGPTAAVQLIVPEFKTSALEVVPAERRSPCIILRGAKVRNLSVHSLPKTLGLALPVTIDHAVNATLSTHHAPRDEYDGVKLDPASLPRGVRVIDGVPFCFADSENGQAIDVLKAKHAVRQGRITKEVRKEDPPRTYAELGYSLEVHGDQYSAVHLIAFSARRPETAPRLDVRVGFRGFAPRTADEWVDAAVDVPYLDEKDRKSVV